MCSNVALGSLELSTLNLPEGFRQRGWEHENAFSGEVAVLLNFLMVPMPASLEAAGKACREVLPLVLAARYRPGW